MLVIACITFSLETGGLAYSGDAYSAVMRDWPLPCVAAGGVVGPGAGGVGPVPLGGGVVEAEGFGDDRGGGLEDELAQGGDPGGAHGEAEVAEQGEDGGVGGGLAGVAAGEQPGAAVGWPAVDLLVEQGGEGLGDGCGRVAEADPGVPVLVVGDVAGGQAQDAAEWLGVEQHEAGDGPDPQWQVVVGEVAADEGEAAVLGDGLTFVEADLREAQRGNVTVGHGPGEEAAGALFLVNGCGGVPGVDVGLGEMGGLAAGAGGPGQEVLGLDEPLFGVFAGAGPQGAGGGAG